MRPALKIVALAGIALASAWGVGRIGAQEEAKTTKSARGGLLAKTERYQFEVFFYPTGVRVFPQDNAGVPVDTTRLAGTATFYHPNSPTPWFSRPLRGAATIPGQAPAALDLAIGLSNAPATGAKVTVEVTGLPDSAESKATFTLPLEFAPPPPTAGPMPPQGGVPTVPRYTYGPGYYGYGYYEYTSPAPQPRPAGRHSYATTPGMFGPGGMTVGPYHRDWTTGRSSPLAKPWLRPMD